MAGLPFSSGGANREKSLCGPWRRRDRGSAFRRRYTDKGAGQSRGKEFSRRARRGTSGEQIRCRSSDRNACDSQTRRPSPRSLTRGASTASASGRGTSIWRVLVEPRISSVYRSRSGLAGQRACEIGNAAASGLIGRHNRVIGKPPTSRGALWWQIHCVRGRRSVGCASLGLNRNF